jgi:pimeloyl-ACP methyl ester carboxylesterase
MDLIQDLLTFFFYFLIGVILYVIIIHEYNLDNLIHHGLFYGQEPSVNSLNIAQKHTIYPNFHQGFFTTCDGFARISYITTRSPSVKIPSTLIFFVPPAFGNIHSEWGNFIHYLHKISNEMNAKDSNHQYVVATCDYRNYGESISLVPPNPSTAIHDSKRLIRILQKEYDTDRLLLYGTSLGAAVVWHLKKVFPTSVVCLESPILGESTLKWSIPLFYERFPCLYEGKVDIPIIKRPMMCFFENHSSLIDEYAIRFKFLYSRMTSDLFHVQTYTDIKNGSAYFLHAKGPFQQWLLEVENYFQKLEALRNIDKKVENNIQEPCDELP